MTRSLVLIPRDGDRQFLTKEQAEELLAGVPDYVEPVAEKPVVVEPAAIEFAGGNPADAGKAFVSDKPLVFSPAGSVVFDNPLSDNRIRTQGRHFSYYNRVGRVMACLPDYFAAGLANDKDLIMKLRRDLGHGVVCGDRFFYKLNSGDATIVRPYGSTVVKPETVNLIIPHHGRQTLNNVLDNPVGNAFVRGLFRIDPFLNNDDIANVFLNLTGLSGDIVMLHTLDYTDRLSNIKMKAVLYLGGIFFDIFCNTDPDGVCISHTVSYIPKGGGAGK